MLPLPETSAPERLELSLPVSVRLCTREDLPALEWYGLYTAHREIIAEAWRRQEQGDNLMLLAEANGAPAGQVWIDLARSRAARAGFLWAVRVVPWLEGLGIGSWLVGCAERLLRARGLAAAELGVEKKNAGARRLYQRLGYRPVGELQEEYGFTPPGGAPVRVAIDEWLLRKRIDEP